MTPTIRLGRLFGIEVGFNWSLIVIFALVAWTLAGSVLPAAVPGQSTPAYWLAGLAGAVVFFACLLVHELAHAIAARRRGMRVGGITLWLFGGVSQLEGEPPSARAEAVITGVGPLASLVVAGLAYAVAVAGASLGAPALFTQLAGWLAFLNLALAVFNLVPAFPLDGGRLLGSLLWWRTGSRRRGVRDAVRVGRVVALLMIGLGLVELFLGSVVSGIWIAFIGWFLLSAAGAELSAMEARAALRSVPVSAAMSSPVVTLPEWIRVEDFLASVASQHRFTTYPLHAVSGELTGVVRLRDLVRASAAERATRTLRDLARPIAEVPRARPEESLGQVIERVGEALESRVLVFADGRLVGIVSPSDVARILALRQALASRHPRSVD
ncbi:MAG TPA: site-2 protease family protein [Candidatus Dormibacteraeota bacterium]|jgi:Zn-dependent protease/CBS domain-containing protein|nr:site-2 protease family protein [Candidatus Dormibacteraeota bacterium]